MKSAGSRDIEDSLERLDELTQEEAHAHMASAAAEDDAQQYP
jgi:hypothetical protein